MAIFKFIRAIAEGETITVFGDGGERDFTYVEDVARGVIAAQRPLGYQIINLGNDHPMAASDVIAMLEQALGKEAVIEYAARHPVDVQATRADIGRKGVTRLGASSTLSGGHRAHCSMVQGQ